MASLMVTIMNLPNH